MSSPGDFPPLTPEPGLPVLAPEPEQKRGQPVIAWIVIVLVAGLVVVPQFLKDKVPQPDEKPGEGDRVSLMLLQMNARLIVGAAEMTGSQADRSKLLQQAQALNVGPPAERFRYVVIVGELGSPAEAERQLEDLRQQMTQYQVKLSPELMRVRDSLGNMYKDYAAERWDAPSVKPEEKQLLVSELGWYGKLALAPPKSPDTEARDAAVGSARRTLVVLICAGLGIILLALGGFVGLVIFLVFLFTGGLQRGIRTGLNYGGIYAETFAVWMTLFVAMSLALAVLTRGEEKLLYSGAVFLVSLVALAWPVIRGVPWRQVREDVGLNWGRLPPVEPFVGIGTYIMALPILAIGLVFTLILISIQASLVGQPATAENPFAPVQFPSHPVIQYLAGPDWAGKLQVLLLGSVCAPLIEETMFRGVLYRHLREATHHAGLFGSLAVSALISSFVFAVIHPQGIVAVPLLMSLAIAFCLAREWRGSLVPSMVAHGLSNGLVFLFIMLVMGD